MAKAGSTAMTEVYQYAEQVTAKGFVVMDTPGLDPVSVTGIVAGGAQVMVFTTGRGSCFGCKPTPSIKVATNTPMYERMIDDMDINAGTILAGRGVDEVGREIFEEIIAVASGKTHQERTARHRPGGVRTLEYRADVVRKWFVVYGSVGAMIAAPTSRSARIAVRLTLWRASDSLIRLQTRQFPACFIASDSAPWHTTLR